MATLKKELNDYLSRKEKSGIPLLPIFSTNTQDQEQLLTPEEPSFCSCNFPSLSRFQRIMGFFICIAMGIFLFGLSMFYIPLLLLKARKFGLLYSLASCCFLCSFCFLWGPLKYMKHLFSTDRIIYTLIYFGSLFSTLYSAMYLRSTIFTIIFSVVQFACVFWSVLKYIPGGTSGISLFTRLFTSSVGRVLPI